MKKLFVVFLLAMIVAAGFYAVQGGWSKTKAYYAGDAIYHDNQVLAMSTNTGKLEIFRAEGAGLKRVLVASPVGSGFDTFNSAIFAEEGGRLYVYATSGATLFKYDASDLSRLEMVSSSTDSSWDWFGRVDKVDGQVVTIGSKAVKVWNTGLQVVDSYNVINTTNPYNVRLSADGRFIFNIQDGMIKIFDRETRSYFRNIALTTYNEKGNKQMYYDQAAQMIYVIDDAGVKRFGLDGGLYKTLEHDSRFGYDVVKSGDSLFISNGTSVAKLNAYNFKIEAGFENRAAGLATSWAMGLVPVMTDKGQQVVVFNNDNIVLLDAKLKLQAKVVATDKVVDKEMAIEPLALSMDKSSAAPLSAVALRGMGYFPNEELDIYFADRLYQIQSDKFGRFSTVVYVPTIKQDKTDIKVTGKRSGLTYSSSFHVEIAK